MLKALAGLLIAGTATLAMASPAAAAPVCTDGVPSEITGPYAPPIWYIAYFDAYDYCTGDALEIVSIDWGGYSWSSGSSGGLDGITGPETVLVTVQDWTLATDTFYLTIDP